MPVMRQVFSTMSVSQLNKQSEILSKAEDSNYHFGILAGTLQVVMIALYLIFVNYSAAYGQPSSSLTTPNEDIAQYYPMFQDIQVMMYVGFGYLMTFLKKYGYSSVGYNFFLTAFVIQWSILVAGFFINVHHQSYHHIEISVLSLINANFAAAAILISFGAVLGKLNALQLLTMAFFEVLFYNLNYYIIILELGVGDAGGSIYIHLFGAYFGLAVAYMFGTPQEKCHAIDNATTKTSDTFAMIGTVFLFIYWPSFNAGTMVGNEQVRCVVNTVLAITSSCLFAFITAAIFNSKNRFDMVHIQNSTLAGGVAIGASAAMLLSPGGAMIIGCAAGVLSVLGYIYVQPFLEEHILLFDSCGVHNLHGMPGFFGGVISMILAGSSFSNKYLSELTTVFPHRSIHGPLSQAAVQFGGVFITLFIAISSGICVGFLLKQEFFGTPDLPYSDSEYWEVPEGIENKSIKQINTGSI